MDSKVYKCELKTLSPIFIGSGKYYGPSEYVNANAKQGDKKVKIIKRVDFANFYMSLDEDQQDKFLANLSNPKGRLEQEYDKIPREFTRYNSINKSSISKDSNHAPEISEHIKTSDKLYIPGSSIKGAIKTAIFYNLLEYGDIDKISDYVRNGNRGPYIDYWGFNNFADTFFSAPGRNPAQKSIMRFIQISDSTTSNLPTIYEILTIMAKSRGGMPDGVENYSRSRSVVKTYLETIDKDKKFTINFTINFDKDVLKEVNLTNKGFILDMDYLKKVIFEFSRDLIRYELDFAEKYKIDYLEKFYNDLAEKNCVESPLLRIGAGSGLMATSISMKIKDYDPILFDDIRETFRRQYPYEFPKSRKVTKTGLPLSWVQLNFK